VRLLHVIDVNDMLSNLVATVFFKDWEFGTLLGCRVCDLAEEA